MKRLLAICGLVLGMTGQLCAVQPSGGPANIAGTLYASNFATWTVPQGNNGPYSWSSSQVCTSATSGGISFQPFIVGSPIRIVDTSNPALSENVVPTQVNITGSGCSITVNPVNQHYGFYLTTATAGLQDAINYSNQSLGVAVPASVVILTPAWAQLGGTTSMITSAIGNTRVTLLDQRTSVSAPYLWNGTQYVFTPYGGGSNPAPPQYAVQYAGPAATAFNADPTFSFNTATHGLSAFLTNGGFNTDVAATGGGNNGISNLINSTNCTTGGCYFTRPQTSTDSENIPLALNSASEYTHALDSTYGTLGHYFHNSGLNLSSNAIRAASPQTCVWNDVLANPFSKQYCNNIVFASNNAGAYVSGSPTAQKINNTSMYVYGRSISQRDNTVMVCYHVGDCMDGYHYMFFRGGAIAANDEATKGNVLEMQEVAAPYGTVITGGANATFIKGNWGGSLGVAGDGMNLVDTSQILDSSLLSSCSLGGGQLPNFCTTSTTHAVDTAYATLASGCGTVTTRNAPISTTCTITGLVGTFSAAANATVCVADWSQPEQAAITNVVGSTITVNLAYSHVAGVRIEQGPLCGGKMALGYGLTDPSSTHAITSYFVAGSTSATTIDYVLQYRGGAVGASTIQIPALPVVNLANCGTLTRASNVVTTATNCAAGSAFSYNNFVAPGTSTIVIAGATPSDLNGVVTNVKVTNSNISWSQTGANETGSGGTLSLTGYNNEVTYCGAETVYIPNMTMSSSNVPVFDGTVQTEANNCPWTVGDSIIQPNHYSTYVPAVQWLTAQGTTNGGLATNIGIELGLTGNMFSGATDIDVFQGDASSSLVGLGGIIAPHLFVHDREFYGTGFLFDNAPLNGGSLFSIGAPVGGAMASSYSYPLFRVIGVNGTSLFSFNPGNSTFDFNSPMYSTNYVGAQGAIGVGNIVGLSFIPPGTAGLGGYFTPIGQRADTMDFGTGLAGDGTGTLGMNNLSAANLTAGAGTPPNFTVFTSGTTGSTTYTYACTAVTANGESPAGTGTTTVGNATLSATNFNQPKCFGVPGAQSLNIYRTVGGATQGFLANVPNGNGNLPTAQVFDDTGLTANPARTPPTTNTTGTLVISGSQSITGVQGTTGVKLAATTGSFTNGNFRCSNATLDEVDCGFNSSNFALLNANNTFTGGSDLFNGNLTTLSQLATAAATPATSSANVNSPKFLIVANAWSGTSSGEDQWAFQNILGTGSSPSSTLSITHVGGSGTMVLPPVQGLQFASITGSIQCLHVNTLGVVTGTGSDCGSGGGGGMTWPAAAGIAVYAGGSAWGTSLTAPTGAIVGTSDTQTLTNKTIDGVTPTTMGFVDFTSSGQTQLNAKAPLASPTFTGTVTMPITGSTQCLHVNSAGVVSGTGSDCGTGSGGITGSGTTGFYGLWSGTTAMGNGHIDDGVTTVATITATEAVDINDSTGTGGGFSGTEGTAKTGATGSDAIWADATDHRLAMNNNNGGKTDIVGFTDLASASLFGLAKCDGTTITCIFGVISATGSKTIASGTATLGTSAIASATCATVVTVSGTGILSTDAIAWNPNASIKAVTGYVPSTSGGLTISAYPTAGDVNFDVCNWTASSITPGAVAINWRVTR